MATPTPRHVNTCRIDIPAYLKTELFQHLFPGDDDEHGAVLAASLAWNGDQVRLLVRHVMIAEEDVDYVPGVRGYRRLSAEFVHRALQYCRDRRLVYLAVHNHGGSDRVAFSSVDLRSHERGYPALLDLMQGLPVGALVFASRAAAGDIWWSAQHRTPVTEVRVIGHTLERLRPSPEGSSDVAVDGSFDRQIRIFGGTGQARLAKATVGVIGAGGAGSLIIEYLARLGVGKLIVADPDDVERSNLSRIVGASHADVEAPPLRNKTLVAQRVAQLANPSGTFIALQDSVVRRSVAQAFCHCDFLFLAADSASARLVFNAIVQQYYIPGIQVGAKVIADVDTGEITEAFSVMRWVLPGFGCLWCSGLISPHRLAWEAKSEVERADQNYGTESPNPSVITLNAVAASHAANEFLFAFQGMRRQPDTTVGGYMWHHLSQRFAIDGWHASPGCAECGASDGARFGQGDSVSLPTNL